MLLLLNIMVVSVEHYSKFLIKIIEVVSKIPASQHSLVNKSYRIAC